MSSWTFVAFPVLMSTILSKAVKWFLRAFKVSVQFALLRIWVIMIFILAGL
ncbi:hypothetical protein C4K06_5109 [Pseudomonas chlororaphis subsp. aureofaciens]|nr:hypothetical protein C4K06_5109 [Pseudomonas chlororaphis subsp. aureofaciens]